MGVKSACLNAEKAGQRRWRTLRSNRGRAVSRAAARPAEEADLENCKGHKSNRKLASLRKKGETSEAVKSRGFPQDSVRADRGGPPAKSNRKH